MQTMSLSVMDAIEYVEDFCWQESIGKSPSALSYSAITRDGVTTYYKIQNGNKRPIPKEEFPEFLENKVESATVVLADKLPQQSRGRIHTKGRRRLIYASIPFFAVGIFYLYQIYVSKALAIDSLNVVNACGVIILCLYFFYFALWLDETIDRRQHNNR